MKGTLLVCLLVVLANSATGQQLGYRFGQFDYEGQEGNVVTVEVVKEGTNDFEFFLNITTFTISEAIANGALSAAPDEVLILTTGADPAEVGDFVDSVTTVSFPPSNINAETTVDITLSDDAVHENQEVFVISLTVSELSNSRDVMASSALFGGVAAVLITDNDNLLLRFEQPSYNVDEANQVFSDLVFIVTDASMVSEVVVPFTVEIDDQSAMKGFDFLAQSPQELELQPGETRRNITFEILDDNIFELQETIDIQLSLPSSVPIGVATTTPFNAVVRITDNDVVVVGFQQTEYNVSESGGSVRVCVGILVPQDTSLLDNGILVQATVIATDDTAVAPSDYTPPGFIVIFLSVVPLITESCFDVPIQDDTTVEGEEFFDLLLEPNPPEEQSGNILFDPIRAVVRIIDDDAPPVVSSTPSPSPSPSPTLPPPTAQTFTPTPSVTPTRGTGLGGDPHYSIQLPSGQMLCFSVHGEPGFSFNLISNKWLQMNARFVQDPIREEITWIGSLGIVVYHSSYKDDNTTKIRFEAKEKKIYIGSDVSLQVQKIEKLKFENGRLSISEAMRAKSENRPEVEVELVDAALSFTVRFVKSTHVDIFWNKVGKQDSRSHGIIGQFFRDGVEIDEPRRLLLLPALPEPVSVMRKPVWHFMEREVADDQLCWVAMNPGYQGKKLIQGHYFDYLVNDVLSTGFKFKPKKRYL